MDLPRRASGCPFVGAGEEEPSRPFAGTGEEELGQRGAVAWPLDGGVLTRWGVRAPARGPATAPWSLHRPLARCLALVRSVVLG